MPEPLWTKPALTRVTEHGPVYLAFYRTPTCATHTATVEAETYAAAWEEACTRYGDVYHLMFYMPRHYVVAEA